MKKCKDCEKYFKDPICYLAEIKVIDGNTEACKNFRHCHRNEEDYTPSATNGDYSPSNPWDAPGMSIRDFF